MDKATFGAVNIHPSPPEHPGLWGFFCQPVIRRDIRAHHGTTMHEIDEEKWYKKTVAPEMPKPRRKKLPKRKLIEGEWYWVGEEPREFSGLYLGELWFTDRRWSRYFEMHEVGEHIPRPEVKK